mgnify:CR=1
MKHLELSGDERRTLREMGRFSSASEDTDARPGDFTVEPGIDPAADS